MVMKKDGFKYIVSIGLILLLLYPSMVKFDHHHDHENLPVDLDGNNIQKSHTSCTVCEFQFSTFENNTETEYSIFTSNILLIEKPFVFRYYSNFNNYNFSLRAPPSFC